MKSFANTSRKLLWVSHVSFCPLFSLLLHRFECLNSRVCVCAWFECCSFVADSWNDTNCYHCAPLSLWKLTTTTEKFTIHEVQILDSQYSLKATWRGGEMTLMNDEYKTVLPPPKKPPVLINAGDVCWAEHMRCFCLFIIPTGNALIGLNSSTYSRERPEDAKSTAANFAFKHERREEIRGNQQFTFALTSQC